jgi:hypothetical protein
MTQVLEALECVEVDGREVYRCLRCQTVLGPAEESYTEGAMSFEVPASTGVPAELAPTGDRYVLRHHCCPGCAVLFEVEMVVAGAEPLSSVDLGPHR